MRQIKELRERRGGRARQLTDAHARMIPKWVDAGASAIVIADACGVKVSTLKTFCAERRISLALDEHRYLTGFRRIVARKIGKKRFAKLRAAAAIRGIDDDALVGKLLSVIIDDDMFNAVLDEN